MKRRSQAGLSYVEILIAAALLAVCLPAAMSALHSGVSAQEAARSEIGRHDARRNLLERLRAEPYSALLDAAETAGGSNVPTSYGTGVVDPIAVYLAPYDGDADPFVVTDPNHDGDGNLYTGYLGTLWVRVAHSDGAELVSLISPHG